jgi:hypothetical protein
MYSLTPLPFVLCPQCIRSIELLGCWDVMVRFYLDIRRYRATSDVQLRGVLSKEIFDTFIARGSKYEVNVNDQLRRQYEKQFASTTGVIYLICFSILPTLRSSPQRVNDCHRMRSMNKVVQLSWICSSRSKKKSLNLFRYAQLLLCSPAWRRVMYIVFVSKG